MTQVLVFLAVFTFNAYKEMLTTPALDSAMRVLTVLSDVTMIVLALMRLTRNSGFYGSRFLLLLLLGATFTILLSLDRTSLSVQLSALREPVFFLACLVVVHDIFMSEHAEQFKKYMTVLLIIFCIAQLPASFMQFLEWGPSDHVGGTLGYATNVLTLLMFLLAFHFVTLFGSSADGGEFSIGKIALFSLLLAPCTINETKISFILLPVFFALLTFTRKVYKVVPVAFLAVGLVVLFGAIYSEYVKSTDLILDEKFLERYLVYDERMDVDIPRGQKMTMTLDLMAGEPLTYAVGFGYGSMGGRNLLETSMFSRSVWWMKGARAFLNTAWFQGGLILVFCLGIPMFMFLRSKNIVSRNMKRFRFFLFFILAAMWLYHDSLYTRAFAAIVAYLILWTEFGGIDQRDDGDDEEKHESGLEEDEPEVMVPAQVGTSR